MIMKGKLAIVLALLVIIIVSLLYYSANIHKNKLLSQGDTFIYDRYYLWESNDQIITPPSNAYFFTNNNSLITLRIINISSQMLNVQMTTKFQNGTETIEHLSVNVKTGENNPTADFLGDTRFDKNINLIQTSATNINYTQTKVFNDIKREVNTVSTTTEGQTIFKWGQGLFDNLLYPTSEIKEICYDSKTGLFLKYQTKLFMYNQNNINLNATIQQFINIRDIDALNK